MDSFANHHNSRINEDEARMDAHTILPDRNSDHVSLPVRIVRHF